MYRMPACPRLLRLFLLTLGMSGLDGIVVSVFRLREKEAIDDILLSCCGGIPGCRFLS
jgi:hypothetical protein